MFNSPYETTPCKLYRIDKITEQLERLPVNYNHSEDEAINSFGQKLQVASLDGNANMVRNVYIKPLAVNIPIFIHPITIPSKDANGFDAIISDCRDCTRTNAHGVTSISAHSEFEFIRARNYLQGQWHLNISMGSKSMPVNNFAMYVFSRLIADAFTMRSNLDLLASTKVQALAAFYYYSMHQKNKELSDYELPNLVMKISKAIKVPTTVVGEIIDDVTYIENIEDFCDRLISKGISSVFEDINPAVVFGILRRAWMGKNSPEIIAVSLEHPPTFEAMLYMAAINPTFSKTSIGVIAKKDLKDRDALSFIERITQLILGKTND